MMEFNTNFFEGKRVNVTKNDGFVLYGLLLKQEPHGIWLQLKSKTVFITYSNLKEIALDERGGY